METIKLKYKKKRKVFIPDREVDLPDNFSQRDSKLEVELPEINLAVTNHFVT